MKINKQWLIVLLLMVGLIVAGTAVYADINNTTSYTISHSVIAGGGHQSSTSGAYSLSGTTGQAAGKTAVTSGNYTLTSGFWYGNGRYTVYLPTIIK